MPVTVAALIVTAAPPVEVSVSDWVVGEFTVTLPKARLVALTVSAAEPGFNCKAKLVEALPAVAVSVAVCAEVTAETVAANVVLVALAATVTVAGTVTAELLLARLTVVPALGAAPFRVTVHESVPPPVIEELVQESALKVATPVPLRLTVAAPPEEALLEMVSVPVAAPEVVGSNCTCRVAVWFGVNVTGNVAPETVKPVPVIVAELMVSVPLPLEVSVTDCDVGVFRLTFPNERLLALRVSAGVVAFSCRA